MHLAPSFTNQRAVGANADERIRVRIAHPTPAGGARFSFKKWHSVFPQNRYFQEAGAASGTGLVQQTVQIVASHDLTLFVRRHGDGLAVLPEPGSQCRRQAKRKCNTSCYNDLI